MRFADYFAQAFTAVSSAQFPWVKTFRESPVAKLSEVGSFFFFCIFYDLLLHFAITTSTIELKCHSGDKFWISI